MESTTHKEGLQDSYTLYFSSPLNIISHIGFMVAICEHGIPSLLVSLGFGLF